MPRTLALLAALLCFSPAGGEPYIRVQERDDTGGVALQIATRAFERAPGEPRVTLVGVSHVGDDAYYAELQERLDAHGLVLFEGVGPMWARPGEDASDADRAAATRARIRTLAIAIENRRRAGEKIGTLADLVGTDGGYNTRLLRIATRDAWGHPIRYRGDEDGIRLESLGSDGRPGGRGPDADITLADLPPLADDERAPPDGIQAQLADAAGLVFQLDEIRYDQPGWRNSDTTAEALSFALAGRDPADARPAGDGPAAGGGQPLFDLMSGRGMLGRVAGGLLKLMGSSRTSSAFLRLLLIETLGQAESLMEATGSIEGLDRMMEVLLERRNQVVMGDIRRAIESGEAERVAVFYGAAHLPDLEEALRGLGYRPAGTEWLDAITVEPGPGGMNAAQIERARSMIGGMLSMQAGALQRPGG